MWEGLSLALLLALKMEEWGHEPEDAGDFSKLEKGKEADLPLEPPEKNTPYWHLDFISVRLISYADLQNCSIINLCCFNPWNIGYISKGEIYIGLLKPDCQYL